MKRRKFIGGVGAIAVGGAAFIGTGAFTSVQADRNVSVAVANDADAFLQLAPCEGSTNGDYVTGADTGIMTLDLSGSNGNVAGDGLNSESETIIHDVFQIANQGTQTVGVWLDIDSIDNGNNNPAVALYQGDDLNSPIMGETNAVCLDPGDTVCVGLVARTYGLDSSVDNLLNPVDGSGSHEMVIHADVESDC